MPEFQDHVEVEWQFDADDLQQVERWIHDLPSSVPFALTNAEPDEHVDTYFDTDDWRVYRAGYALRLRRSHNDSELTLKSLNGREAGFTRRREVTQPLAGVEVGEIDQVAGPVGERVAAIRGRNPTRPLFTVITKRQRYQLWHEGQAAGELALDHATFIGASFEEQTQLSRAEVETTIERIDLLRQFVDTMVNDCSLRTAVDSKFATGMRIEGLNPAPIASVGSTKFGRESTITDLAFAVLRRHFIELLRHEPGTRLGDDVEELHDMRVAARRLRAALALFSRFLDQEFEAVRAELRWVAAALGEVRDLDVQLAEIRTWQEDLDARDAEALDALIDVVNRRRDAARERMLAVLDSERYERFQARFAELLVAGPDSNGSHAAVDVAPELVMRRYRTFHRLAGRLNGSSADAKFHEVRIEGKRLRYALEFVSPLYGKVVEQFIEQLVAVQDLLGRHQDSIVAIEHLRDLSVDSGAALSAPAVFAMGRVAERYATAAIISREKFLRVYKRFNGKRMKRLEKEMRRPTRSKRTRPEEAPRGEGAVEGGSQAR